MNVKYFFICHVVSELLGYTQVMFSWGLLKSSFSLQAWGPEFFPQKNTKAVFSCADMILGNPDLIFFLNNPLHIRNLTIKPRQFTKL